MTDLRFVAREAPILGPTSAPSFDCPIVRRPIAWAAKDVFNPAAVVRDGIVHLLFRAEDADSPVKGTSRIGLATSEDGETYTVAAEPVLYPDRDEMLRYEWPGGVEDARIVEIEGGYHMTYTAFDGQMARLAIATSPDLRTWTKHGLAFEGEWRNRWSKSGAVLARLEGDRVVATRIAGKYWMYFGEGELFLATSDDLIAWDVVEFESGANRLLRNGGPDGWWEHVDLPGSPAAYPVARPRAGRFDAELVEPGPFALLTDQGIELAYNGAGGGIGVPGQAKGSYAPGWLVFDPLDLSAVIRRSTEPFLTPERPMETQGQYPNVIFLNGLCRFRGRWLMPYGAGDSQIGLAVADE